MDKPISNHPQTVDVLQETWPASLQIALLGKLAAMRRADAIELLQQRGATAVERGFIGADCIVLGADADRNLVERIDPETRRRIDDGFVELVDEADFWSRLGFDDAGQTGSGRYTPRMLAELADTPLREIRRWIRLGLLNPVRVVHRLHYFDFEGLQSARQLRQWNLAGLSADSIVKQLKSLLAKFNDEGLQSIRRWDIHLDGQALMVRYQGGWIDWQGQTRIDFDSQPDLAIVDGEVGELEDESDDGVAIVSISAFQRLQHDSEQAAADALDRDALFQLAEQAEDEGKLEEAVEWFRVLLAKNGPQPELHFSLAELLYRLGETTAARERYYAALELDNDFIEARANLGCVLVELGQADLAVAAFQGALAQNEQYPDVHYHLARTLDDLNRPIEAANHWQRFIELAPTSPWAYEANERLHSPSGVE